MSFSWMPTWAFLAGLAGLAAALFALQRLRVRHRTLIVPTTQFWREAVEETRARVFVQRFRHPWTYVLLVAIAALLWTAVAGPRAEDGDGAEHVLVLDASAAMAVGDRFPAALEALEERVAELPRATTRVLVAGAHVRTLLDRGEERALLARRAAGLRPEACPATVERAVASLSACAAPPAGRTVEIFGDAPLDPGFVARVKESGSGVTDVRRAPGGARDDAGLVDAGVLALGASESASGDWRRVDVHARVRADASTQTRVAIGGVDVPVTWTEEAGGAGGARVLATRLDDVLADGRSVEVITTRAGDALPADDRAALVLPVRAPIRVAFVGDVPALVRDLLTLDPGIAAVDDVASADVLVRLATLSTTTEKPTLELTDATDTQAAFVVRGPAALDVDAGLHAAQRELGLAEIDATGLATAARRAVALEFEDAPVRSVAVWSTLFGTGFDFGTTRAGPLFLARALRWLADAPACAPEAAAGRPWRVEDARWTEADGRRIDALGAPVTLPVAGSLRDARGAPLEVALLDADATSSRGDARALPAPDRAAVPFAREPSTWILLAALALFLFEWWSFRKERIA